MENIELQNELQSRMLNYKKQVREFWYQSTYMAVLAAVVVFSLMWCAINLLGVQPEVNLGVLHTNYDVWVLAAVIACALMIPPIVMMYPAEPNLASIEYDRLLNEIGRVVTSK